MKKTLYGMIILVTCFMVTACVKEPEHVTTGPYVASDNTPSNNQTSPIIDEPQVNIDIPEVQEEVPEVQEKVDPLEVLEVSEDFAKEKKLLCLYRDNKLYSLGPKYISSDGKYVLPTGFDDGKDYVINIDAPEIIIQEGDQIRDYGDEYVNVYKSTFTGYTIPMFKFNDGAVAFDDEVDPSSDGKPSVKGITGDITQVEVKDINGGVVNNYRYLENSKSYKVSWYSGMDYREITMTANWKYYKIDSTPSYKLKGVVGPSGYALIDIRDIPSGTYHLGVRDTNTTLTGEEVFPITIPDNGNDDNSNQQVNDIPEEDSYEVLLLTPEYAMNKTYEIALLYRDGSYYSLGDFSEASRLYLRRDKNDVYTVWDEPPIITLEEGDVVYGFTDDGSVPKLSLRKASRMPGYTIPLSIDNDGDVGLIDEEGQYLQLWKLDISALEIVDEDGNNLSIEVNEDENNLPSLHNLDKGKIYTFGYYEGIYYKDYNLICSNVEYEIEKDTIEVPGEITKEGYIYDFSGIEPGLYYTNYNGFITVK